MEENTTLKIKILSFLRIESISMTKWTTGGILIGIIAYFVFAPLELPRYTFLGLDLGITVIPITGGVDLGLVIIVLIAAFCGPLAGFLVGFFGSLGANILYTQQIVAFGSINFAFGMLGFIVGIPRYTQDEGFADGQKLAKLILLILAGYFLMILLYLLSLIVIAGQSFEGTLLYNFAPSFSITLISLFLFAPVLVRITEIIINEGMRILESRVGTE